MEEERWKKKLSPLSDEGSFDDGDDQRRLLSKLLSQLGAARMDASKEIPCPVFIKANGDVADELKEILRVLKKVERQNFITHCLLSVLIVLTVTWQLYELCLYMKVKEALSRPFRIFGSMFTRTRCNGKTRTLKAPIVSDKNVENESSTGSILTGILKGSKGDDQNGQKDSSSGSVLTRILKGSKGTDQNRERETSTNQKHIEGGPLLPPVNISELPRLDLPLGKMSKEVVLGVLCS